MQEPQTADAGLASPVKRSATPPLWLLAFVTIIGTISNHLFVPALPGAALDLGVGPGAVQMTISVFLVGLAVGQLIYGPLSDAYGRRPMLLLGVTLFVIGSIAAACAPNLATLLVARVIHALGGCAGIVLGRAIVRDTTQGDDTMRQLALLGTMVLVWPGTGPILGGAMAAAAGWRAIFVLLVIAGIAAFYLTWRRLPETKPGSGRFTLRSAIADYRALLQSIPFLGFVLGAGAITTSIYAFLSAAPFILGGRLHQSVQMVGLYSGLVMFGVLAGTAVSARLLRHVGGTRLLAAGAAALAISSGALLVLLDSSAFSVGILMGCMLLFTCGIGMVHPVLLGKALALRPDLAGSASGLYGFSQMALGAVSATLAGVGSDPSASCMRVLCGATVVACICVACGLWREQKTT